MMSESKSISHDSLIRECFMWHWNTFPEERQMLFGINNNSTNAAEGARNKGLGVVKGVLDLCYILPGAVIWMDGKVGRDVLSKEQEEFIRKCKDRGHICTTFSSLSEFQRLIQNLQEVFYV